MSFTNQELKRCFENIDDKWKQVLVRDNSELFKQCIELANSAAETKPLSPTPNLAFKAFELCKYDDLSVVIIGQDPFIKQGEATGLSFSVPKGCKIPPSTKNIHESLLKSGFIDMKPTHGNLEYWAKQGVLMLNMALTTILGKSNAHKFWHKYTKKIIRDISSSHDDLIFILWGGFAQDLTNEIQNQDENIILTWGHPSPLNRSNSGDNVNHFRNCNNFTEANRYLCLYDKKPIDWNPDGDSPDNKLPSRYINRYLSNDENKTNNSNHAKHSKHKEIYIATDGAAIANGKANCRASYGFVAISPLGTYTEAGETVPVDIPNKVYKASNQIGELTAFLKALEYLDRLTDEELLMTKDDPIDKSEVTIISDSQYTINCNTIWGPAWIEDPVKHKLESKSNKDLILTSIDLLTKLKRKFEFTILHIRSHKAPPNVPLESFQYFAYEMNDYADNLCTSVLK